MLRSFIVAMLLSTAALAVSANAYQPKSIEALLDQNVQYDPTIPKPEKVTGYPLGEIIYPPHMHASYVEALGEVSDRFVVNIIGKSHFGRPIHQVTISSPANLSRLDEIKEIQRSLVEPDAPQPPADHPVILQFTFGVHGSEPSSYDAAPAILYYLAAAQGPDIEKFLEEAVVNIVVPINPDGANR
ncbi:MAG: M14 family zinc carboxypeptidase, partial [Pseudomonadota bacterium]